VSQSLHLQNPKRFLLEFGSLFPSDELCWNVTAIIT